MRISDEYPDGIKEYTRYILRDRVAFPKGDIRCKWCKFCIYDRNRGGYLCAVTNDILYAIDKGVGWACPLERRDINDD